jgi:hypothetical protein
MLRIPFLLDILTHKDEDTTFPRNLGFQLHSDAATYSTRMESSATLLKKPQHLIWISWIAITLSWSCYEVNGTKSVLKNSWPSRRQQCVFWEYTMITSLECHGYLWWTSTVSLYYKLYRWHWNYYAFFTVQKKVYLIWTSCVSVT